MLSHPFALVLLGFVIGTFGTLIGAGGGFILMPLFFYLYPSASPEYLTGISLAIVFLNAASGSVAYGVAKKIDYRSGIIFSLAALPGAVIGALSTEFISRKAFDPAFGFVLIIVSTYLFFKPTTNRHGSGEAIHATVAGPLRYNMKLGVLISIFVGFISSVLGIGGGIIHVPILVQVLHFPVHIATATSHFILAILALIGTLTHLVNGSLDHEALMRVLYFSPGIILGAQLGAKLSPKINGMVIVRCLAVALASVGLRLLMTSFSFH
ncbi:MAG: hypothetical protein JWQ35_328 [Bacteriovoracaceae bacterium]|nr:hypothetical protein [Bacteriovoracaceae bacterium]